MMKITKIFTILSLMMTFSVFDFAQKTPKADLTKKIQEATPKPLPQAPVVTRLTSNAQDERIKGKVKSLVEEGESFTGIGKPFGKKLLLVTDFNERGDYLKQIAFDFRGVPYEVTVYGYIDNSRVSLSNYVDTGEGFDTDSGGKPKEETKNKPDPRYTFKYQYEYENGQLAKMQLFNNTGSKSMYYIYHYQPHKMEKLAYTEDDELNSEYLYLLDEKDNETGRIDYDVNKSPVSESRKFQYQNVIFDIKGNWIKRTFSEAAIENGKEIYKPIAIEYRKFTYYQ